MLGDINAPNYDLINGRPLPNSYDYNKIKGNSIRTATCFLGPDHHTDDVVNSAILDLVFTNISDLSASTSNFPWSLLLSTVKQLPLILNKLLAVI
jgi:hypothetical protein